MKDTAPDVDSAFTARFASLTPEERLTMMSDMFDDAKALMAADIRARNPGSTPRDLRVEMFKRLYWNDFDPATLARFVASIS